MNDREPELHPQEQTNQIFRQRTSTSVAKRNREILERAARRAGGAVQSGQAERGDNAATESVDGCEEGADRLIPARFNNFWVNLVCTHGWSRKSRGKRIRRCYFEKPTGCKANIKAAATWNDAENFKKFMVRVIDVDVTHNHKVYENHASNRRVEDPVLLAFVDELHAAGSKPKLIVQHLRKKTGKNVLLCDFHNRVAKMKEKRRGLESLWGHIKNNLRADMALDKCVDTLMFLQAVTEMEYSKKTMDVGQMRCDGADAELKKLAREVCPYAYRLIEQQYWSSKDRKLHFEVEELHPRLSVLTGDDPTSACHVDTARRPTPLHLQPPPIKMHRYPTTQASSAEEPGQNVGRVDDATSIQPDSDGEGPSSQRERQRERQRNVDKAEHRLEARQCRQRSGAAQCDGEPARVRLVQSQPVREGAGTGGDAAEEHVEDEDEMATELMEVDGMTKNVKLDSGARYTVTGTQTIINKLIGKLYTLNQVRVEPMTCNNDVN
ncbi:hypothetical protein PI126_g11290 [Phytophthora idaei]|nr:hypothetical protein PI126_g11290 [Phytophthora idaei]